MGNVCTTDDDDALPGRRPTARDADDGSDDVATALIINRQTRSDGEMRTRQQNALLNAVETEDALECNNLVMSGADVNATDEATNQTPLIIAVTARNYEICRILLQTGNADVRRCDRLGITPLHACCSKARDRDTSSICVGLADEMLCSMLLERGADPDARDNNLLTPLHLAAKSGLEALCGLILKTGRANVNVVNSVDETPLHMAVHGGFVSVCRQLIDAGADVCAVDCTGMSPLCVAVGERHIDICKLLIRAGATIPSHFATGSTLRSGARRAIPPIEVAIGDGSADICEMLLQSATDGDAEAICSMRPQDLLNLATRAGNVDICRILLRDWRIRGVIDVAGQGGDTPLAAAALRGYLQICELLAVSGASLASTTRWPVLATHLAPLTRGWSPETHHYFPPAFRSAVSALCWVLIRADPGAAPANLLARIVSLLNPYDF